MASEIAFIWKPDSITQTPRQWMHFVNEWIQKWLRKLRSFSIEEIERIKQLHFGRLKVWSGSIISLALMARFIRWSMLVLSEPSQGGGNVEEKRRSGLAMVWPEHTRKHSLCFCMANIHSGRKVYCLVQPTVNTFLFLCRHTGKRLATQDWWMAL